MKRESQSTMHGLRVRDVPRIGPEVFLQPLHAGADRAPVRADRETRILRVTVDSRMV